MGAPLPVTPSTWGILLVGALLLIELLIDFTYYAAHGFDHLDGTHLLVDSLQVAVTLYLLWHAARRVRSSLMAMHHQADQQGKLAELGQVAAGAPNVRDLLPKALHLLVEVLGCDAVYFVNFTNGAAPKVEHAAGRMADVLLADAGLNERAEGHGAAILYSNDVLTTPNLATETRFWVPPHVQTAFASSVALALPMDDTHRGVLVAYFRAPCAFSAYGLSYLKNVALLLARTLASVWTAAQLRDSEQMFRQLAEHIQDVFYVAAPDCSKMYYVSPAYETVWGLPRASVQRNPRAWLEAIHEEDRALAENGLDAMAQNGYFEKTYRIVLGNGKVRWIHDRSFPVLDDAGTMTRVAGLATDITAMHEAQDMAAQLAVASEHGARVAAEARVRARDEVLAIVSHDLRTPLSSVLMAADRLVRLHPEHAKTAHLAEVIHKAVDRMERLVQDLLEVARLEGGVLRLDTREISVQSLWQEAMEALGGSNNQVVTHFDSLPDGLPNLRVDTMRVLQLLGNLIGNAVKFSPPGSEVEVRAFEVAEGVRIEVRDTGPGIAPEQLEHLFEPFWQGQRHDRRGLGLGLHIAKGIVEAHGGTIGVHSVVQQGTTLWFVLPESSRTHDGSCTTPARPHA